MSYVKGNRGYHQSKGSLIYLIGFLVVVSHGLSTTTSSPVIQGEEERWADPGQGGSETDVVEDVDDERNLLKILLEKIRAMTPRGSLPLSTFEATGVGHVLSPVPVWDTIEPISRTELLDPIRQFIQQKIYNQMMDGEGSRSGLEHYSPYLHDISKYSLFDRKRSGTSSGYICHFKLCQFGSSGKRLVKPIPMRRQGSSPFLFLHHPNLIK